MTDSSISITITRYANQRFYNAATASYVSPDQLRQMIDGGAVLLIRDAKTGDDVTQTVVTTLAHRASAADRWRATIDALEGVARDGETPLLDGATDEADEVKRLIALAIAGVGAAPGAWRHTTLPAMWYRRGRPTLGVASPFLIEEPPATDAAAATGEADRRHAGGDRGLDARHAVLDHGAAGGRRAHCRCRVQE